MTRSQNDRAVYDSEGGLVCRPILPLGPEDEATPERPTLRGLFVVLSEDEAVDALLRTNS